MTDSERDEYNKEDLLEVSSELDGRGDAEFTNPGDPSVDDEESLDEGLLDGADTEFGVENDIDTLQIDDPNETNDDLDDEDYEAESAAELGDDDRV
ncbi:hypothetical protein ITJ38_07700 [Agreia pratensis]|uniref:Uncharacterized protein n=1 Tax=Agreia pratensis TaxID=150121 RepID=A0A1X7K6Y2_9MICO|nr:hypothetical protein [Agreia pratensis]MBF4634280.1 hypothetical protein [Agreia pratensis]SMG36806.1 hypothetical protein SAMN06296010_2190 [Agreia pratensis]